MKPGLNQISFKRFKFIDQSKQNRRQLLICREGDSDGENDDETGFVGLLEN